MKKNDNNIIDWINEAYKDDLARTTQPIVSYSGMTPLADDNISLYSRRSSVTRLLRGGQRSNHYHQRSPSMTSSHSMTSSQSMLDDLASENTDELLTASIYQNVNMGGDFHTTLHPGDETVLEILNKTLNATSENRAKPSIRGVKGDTISTMRDHLNTKQKYYPNRSRIYHSSLLNRKSLTFEKSSVKNNLSTVPQRRSAHATYSHDDVMLEAHKFNHCVIDSSTPVKTRKKVISNNENKNNSRYSVNESRTKNRNELDSKSTNEVFNLSYPSVEISNTNSKDLLSNRNDVNSFHSGSSSQCDPVSRLLSTRNISGNEENTQINDENNFDSFSSKQSFNNNKRTNQAHEPIDVSNNSYSSSLKSQTHSKYNTRANFSHINTSQSHTHSNYNSSDYNNSILHQKQSKQFYNSSSKSDVSRSSLLSPEFNQLKSFFNHDVIRKNADVTHEQSFVKAENFLNELENIVETAKSHLKVYSDNSFNIDQLKSRETSINQLKSGRSSVNQLQSRENSFNQLKTQENLFLHLKDESVNPLQLIESCVNALKARESSGYFSSPYMATRNSVTVSTIPFKERLNLHKSRREKENILPNEELKYTCNEKRNLLNGMNKAGHSTSLNTNKSGHNASLNTNKSGHNASLNTNSNNSFHHSYPSVSHYESFKETLLKSADEHADAITIQNNT